MVFQKEITLQAKSRGFHLITSDILQTLTKRSNRQARNAIAKKLTRGIPKSELTFARKQEIEKRLDKPALKQRIARLAKRMFKDVRKKEVERKKG